MDDHIQYIHEDARRSFINPIGGITPTAPAHLTTQSYVLDQVNAITDVYIVKNGTIAFTGTISGVSSAFDVTPGDYNGELATVPYVTSLITGGVTHSGLTGLIAPADDHTQYIHHDARRAFTVDIEGITTTGGSTDFTLTTKNFVESTVANYQHSHTTLLNLDSDDHTQYPNVDGSIRPFTVLPEISNTGSVPDETPSLPYQLTTKAYVDVGISTLGDTELFSYVDIYGRHSMHSNIHLQVPG